jgi:MFS family permease
VIRSENNSTRWHYAYIILGTGMLCLVSSLGFGRFSYALLLPAMRADFNTSYTQMGSIATANALAYMISVLVCGILTGRFGARVVINLVL